MVKGENKIAAVAMDVCRNLFLFINLYLLIYFLIDSFWFYKFAANTKKKIVFVAVHICKICL
jgi:hypothetical protein